jgi:CIC family chloride channel protein
MRRQRYLLIDTVLLGIIGALGAQLFIFLLKITEDIFLKGLAGYQLIRLPGEGGALGQSFGPYGLWLIPLATTLGGLISGIIVYSIAPEAEGHGTDTAVKAFHRTGGFIRARVTPIKIIASAITIGSGGAAGREGPTALFSSGIGSIYATLTRRSDKERRLLVLIGMAAGLSAIFRSPIGTAFFAIEVLYSDMEFDAEAFLYTMLGSIVAYTVNGLFVGWQPLFRIPPGLSAQKFSDYAWYALLGMSGGIIGTILPNVFYYTRDFFHKIPIPPHLKPAIGGFGVGIIAMALPQVLGGGYGWIQEVINGQFTITLLLLLLFGKMIAFALTVGSGGSGGVFAPSLFVGAMLGGFLAHLFHQPAAAFAVVGMAAVFGSAGRVPFATLLMVTEMTGGYNIFVPAALAVMLGYLIQSTLSAPLKYKSLYESQVISRAESPAHRIENLKTALKILSERQTFDPSMIGHVNLLALLESGIPIDLPDGKQLFILTLSPDSLCVGTPIDQSCLLEEGEEWEIVAIFREEHLILPHPYTVPLQGDQLLVMISPKHLEKLRRKF